MEKVLNITLIIVLLKEINFGGFFYLIVKYPLKHGDYATSFAIQLDDGL